MDQDQLFLPQGYSENQPEPVGAEDGLDYWAREAEIRARSVRRYQDPVYRFAARIARRSTEVVLDVGCGTGDNLIDRVAGRVGRTVGVDQPSAIALAQARFPEREWIPGDLRSDELWQSLAGYSPEMVICADVIEHVDDPRVLLDRLRSLLGREATLVLSTPDRARMEGQAVLGPPKNPHHIREWTPPEMTELLQSNGFVIRSTRHVLPRKYSFNKLDTKIITWRALHLKAVPGRRSCMVFELSRT